MNDIRMIQFVTDDNECISVFLHEALSEVDDEGAVNLQVPVSADGRWGHIYLTSQEVSIIMRSPIIREATRWALNTRLTRYTPRLPKK
jgi:hypothetical protein